ncbi:MAG: hypothetical protein RLZZ155_900 [Bacteroidota bacterium]|jgi:hypothetical protein
MNPTVRIANQLSEDWMLLIFVFALGVIAWVNRDNTVLRAILRSVLSRRFFKQEERREGHGWKNFGMLVCFFLMGGLVLTLVSKRYFAGVFNFLPVYQFLIGVAIVVALFGIKWIMTWLVAFVTAGASSALEDYNKYLALTSRFAVLALTGPLLLAVYSTGGVSDIALNLSVLILVIVPFLSTLQAMFSAMQMGVPFFYIFFYLCTFEVLPWAVLSKLIWLNVF